MSMIRESLKTVNEAQISEAHDAILGLMLLEEMEITDDVNEGVNDILNKFGLGLEKKAPGVIEYMAKFTTGVGKLIWYAMKRDKKAIKKLSKEFTKEDLLDFLMKLDLVTMHLVTGPLHMIAGLTGWDLEVEVKHAKAKAQTVVDKIKSALNVLKSEVTQYFSPKLQPVIIKKVADIEHLVGA